MIRLTVAALTLLFISACGAGSDGDSLYSSPSSDALSDASGGDSEVFKSEDGEISEPDEPPFEDPFQDVQSGLLTAGDYDDLLNPGRYKDYSRDALQVFGPNAQPPSLDLEERIKLTIVDPDGSPQIGARIQINTDQDEQLQLRTAADGVTWLYPSMDNLPAMLQLNIQNQTGDVQLEQSIDTTSLNDQRQIEVTLPVAATASTALDLALIIDTTGSMGDELNYLQAELSDIINSLAQANPGISIRVALILYRDEGDAYVVRTHALTDNINDAQNALNAEFASGGGDYPEAMDQALQAMLGLQWRDEATRVALLVADAPPHTDQLQVTWNAALQARHELIHIVPVAASGVADVAEYMMRSMAALTQGRYLFLTDDSGIGNPHQEPTIDCYLVSKLDGLIGRVVQSLINGERVEPTQDQVLRTVGNYANGVCSTSEQ